MSYRLLKRKDCCPNCGRVQQIQHGRECPGCRNTLFLRPIQFQSYEDDGHLRNYWLWTEMKGWMHRDHIMVKEAKPLESEVKFDKVPEGYGKQTTPEAVVAAGRAPKKALKIKKDS